MANPHRSYTLSTLVLCAAFWLGCSSRPRLPPRPVSDRVWSDAELLDYVLRLGDPHGGWSMPRSSVLGRHNGMNLEQTVSCGDEIGYGDCSRVIHYEHAENNCAQVGGALVQLRIYGQESSQVKQFCFPRILVEHWQQTLPIMTPLDQSNLRQYP